MKELIGAALVFVIVAVSVIIGGAMVSKTKNVTMTIANEGNASNPSNALITSLASDTGNALTTFTSLLPILALAVVGGLALFYLLGFLGRAV